MVSNNVIAQALQLSQSSYETSSKKLVQSLSGTGWSALDNEDLGMSAFKFGRGIGDTNYLYDNFNDQGFVAVKGDTLAIVFTGSATSSILIDRSEIGDWLSNIGAGVAGWKSVAGRYEELYNAAIDYARKDKDIDTVLVTGHSRGGAMAEYHYLQYSDTLDSSGLEMKGVSFASPGVKLDKKVDKTKFLAFEDGQDPVVDSVLSDVNNVTEIALDGPKTGRIASHSLDDNYAPEVGSWLKLGPSDVDLSGNVVVENASIGTNVGKVTATDPNPGDTFSFSLTDDAGGLFEIDGDDLLVKGNINFETAATYSVSIAAKDSGGTTRTESFQIEVTDVDETFPSVSEGVGLAESQINGVINQALLTGNGTADFRVALKPDATVANKNNALGVYEVNDAGEIVDTRLLFSNTNSESSTEAVIAGVEAGHQLGFFLVQDGADWADGLGADDTLRFIDVTDGSAAEIADGPGTTLAVNGADAGLTVFHTFDAALNPDGISHVVSGENTDGQSLILGMEDLLGGGDSDYQDTVFTVEQFDFV